MEVAISVGSKQELPPLAAILSDLRDKRSVDRVFPEQPQAWSGPQCCMLGKKAGCQTRGSDVTTCIKESD